MSAQQIQVIAIFLSHLQRKPSKRVHISERLDLIQQKPSYTPAEDIASPKIPHLVCLQSETDGASEHTHPSRPTLQAPVICQLCGGPGFCRRRISGRTPRKNTTLGQRRESDSSSKSSSARAYLWDTSDEKVLFVLNFCSLCRFD